MIEAKAEDQALVEIFLRFGIAGRNRMLVLAKSLYELAGLLCAGRRAGDQKSECSNKEGFSHEGSRGRLLLFKIFLPCAPAMDFEQDVQHTFMRPAAAEHFELA